MSWLKKILKIIISTVISVLKYMEMVIINSLAYPFFVIYLVIVYLIKFFLRLATALLSPLPSSFVEVLKLLSTINKHYLFIKIRGILYSIFSNLFRIRYLIPNIFICIFFTFWLFLFYFYKFYKHITSPIWKPDKAEFIHNRKRYSPADHGMYNSKKNS